MDSRPLWLRAVPGPLTPPTSGLCLSHVSQADCVEGGPGLHRRTMHSCTQSGALSALSPSSQRAVHQAAAKIRGAMQGAH